MKAQTSFEFLLIIVVGISILIPIVAYVSLYQVSYRDAYKIAMAKDAVDKLGDAAESIYIQGYPAKFSLTVSIPEGVVYSFVGERTVMLKLRTSSGETDVYSSPRANVTGIIPTTSGYHEMVVKNEKTYVNITEER